MQKPHIQFNANQNVATTSPRFCNEPHLLHVFCEGCTCTTWSHRGQSSTSLWLERPSSKSAKFHTVTPSNNKDPRSCWSYFCWFVPHGCCSTNTSRSSWITHSPQRELRDCNALTLMKTEKLRYN